MTKTYRELDGGMGRAVAERTYLRKKNGVYETWGELAHRVALGNSLLCTTPEERKFEYELMIRHISNASMLMSGRHLQHGDETQPDRPMEVFTNCSTSATTFALFTLLMSGCFRKGTPVKMADGSYKPINEIEIGDVVVSYCEATRTFQQKKIINTFVNKPKPMVKITLEDGQEVVCTFDHLFLTVEGEWVMAKDTKGRNILQCPKVTLESQDLLNIA